MNTAVKPEDDDTFGMLRDVVQEALSNGDRRPADVLLASLRGQVERLELPKYTTGREYEKEFDRSMGGTGRVSRQTGRTVGAPDKIREVRKQAREIAKMIANAPKTLDALPNHEHGQAQAFTTVQHRRAKRRHRDPLAYMDLTGRQMRACEEIRRLNEAISRLMEGGGCMTGVVRVDGHGPRKDPILDMLGEKNWDAYVARYRPWSKRQNKTRVKRMTVTNLVLAVIVNGRSTRDIAGELGMRDRKVRQIFRDALNDYDAG